MIFRGPYPDVSIPEVSITDFIFQTTGDFKNKPALVDGPSGRTLTYGQFEDAVRRTAASLHKKGFRKGDIFGIFSTNCPEYGVAFHAIAMLGGISTLVNPLYTAEEAAFQLNNAGARFLVTSPQCVDKAREATVQSQVDTQLIFVYTENTTT